MLDWLDHWPCEWVAWWMAEWMLDWLDHWPCEWVYSLLDGWISVWLAIPLTFNYLVGWLSEWPYFCLNKKLNDYLARYLTDLILHIIVVKSRRNTCWNMQNTRSWLTWKSNRQWWGLQLEQLSTFCHNIFYVYMSIVLGEEPFIGTVLFWERHI